MSAWPAHGLSAALGFSSASPGGVLREGPSGRVRRMREAVQRGADATPGVDSPPGERKPAVDENGVDLTLVRYTLSLTPTQRLLAVEGFMNALATVRPRNRGDSK